jgi:hypothetical protein
MICLLCNDKKEYETWRSFICHFNKRHLKTLTIEQYVIKFKLFGYTICDCGKEFYRNGYDVKYNKHFTCRNKECLEKRRLENIKNTIAKRKKHYMNIYGVDNPAAVPEIQARTQATNLKKWGTTCPLQQQWVIKKANSHEAIIKNHETRVKNWNYRISKAEFIFAWFLFLHKEFIIKQQVKIGSQQCAEIFEKLFDGFKGNFSLDFVVIFEENTFCISFDGIYYHGLDRPITEIAKCKTLTDRTIFNTYYRDRAFEDYCQKINDINFIRFDETTFRKFILEKNKLEPYFSTGCSKQIFLFLEKLKNI